MQYLFRTPRIMPAAQKAYAGKKIEVDVLRLDEIHPVISGNKWYKLKPYLQEALAQNKKAVLTFGGAYSNHILATAAACSLYRLPCMGVIRGEKPSLLSPTLADAQRYGMQLHFISREAYRTQSIPPDVYGVLKKSDLCIINEGGYGPKGAQGSMDILKSFDTHRYTHIVAAVGTGTMLAGLRLAAAPQQQVLGISVLKNNHAAEEAIQNLTTLPAANFRILHDYHFGGYAKHPPALLQFMNDWFAQTGIPTDFVYTAKTFYAADQLIRNAFFSPGSSVLLIQSGGLQGNRSLPAGTLRF